MADFSQLKQRVAAVIKANGRQAITGTNFQAQLFDIIDTMNAALQDAAPGYGLSENDLTDALLAKLEGCPTAAQMAQAIADAVALLVAKADILQTTGTATDKAMSQKAVSDLLAAKVNIADAVIKSQLAQEGGAATDKAISQKAATELSQGKADAANVYTKAEIQTALAPVLKYTEQSLTLDQQDRARRNIGIVQDGSALTTEDIADDLITEAAGKVLSARQGKVLNSAKLDKPSTAGAAGQVLTSDGQGGQTWENIAIPQDAESTANKATDLANPDNTHYPTTAAVANALDGKANKNWEKLCDLVTTEAVMKVVWNKGDNGQVFDDYSELYIMAMLQPTTAGIKTIKLNIAGNNAWNGNYFQYSSSSSVSAPASTEKSNAVISHLTKTPFGIIEFLSKSSNNGSVNNFINMTTGGGNMIALTRNAVWSPDFTLPVFDGNYGVISIGCYTGTPIEANCRFIIFGKK